MEKAKDPGIWTSIDSLKCYKSFISSYRKEDPSLSNKLESIKDAFSRQYQSRMKYKGRRKAHRDPEYVQAVIKPFWDKYCELKKITLN